MGPLEIGLLVVLVLLLFGAKRLPDLGNALGETAGIVRGSTESKVEDEE